MLNPKNLSKGALSYLRFVASPAKGWASFSDANGATMPSITVINALAATGLMMADDYGAFKVTPAGTEALALHEGRPGLDGTPTDWKNHDYL